MDAWTERLGIPVDVGALWHWTEARLRPSIDLLQGEFAPRAVRDGHWHGLRRVALLAAALATITASGASLNWAAKANERDALLTQMENVYRRTFGEKATIADAPLQMTRGLEQLRRQAGQLAASDFVPLFSKVAGRLLDPTRHRVESVAYADGVLTLTVRPVHSAQFSAVFSEMRTAAKLLNLDVRLEPSEATERIMVRAASTTAGVDR